MAVVAFARDEFWLFIVVDIVPGQCVALGKILVDQVLTPGGCPVGLRRELFVPVESVAVAVRPVEVVSAVAIQVEYEDGATGVREVEVMVIPPRAREWAGSGLFVPTGLENDILLLVAIEVAEA